MEFNDHSQLIAKLLSRAAARSNGSERQPNAAQSVADRDFAVAQMQRALLDKFRRRRLRWVAAVVGAVLLAAGLLAALHK